eukprot:159751-Chlamydomonas_euryale.AAC.6
MLRVLRLLCYVCLAVGMTAGAGAPVAAMPPLARDAGGGHGGRTGGGGAEGSLEHGTAARVGDGVQMRRADTAAAAVRSDAVRASGRALLHGGEAGGGRPSSAEVEAAAKPDARADGDGAVEQAVRLREGQACSRG